MKGYTGLSSARAGELLRENGPNTVGKKKKTSAVRIFAGQFRDTMVLILLAATVISAVMDEVYDALTIMVIVVLNAVLGFVQEYRTEKTLEAMKRIAAPTARVYRDGNAVRINAEQLVKGDVILLEAGDKVPADAVILECMALECDESLLTGESVPVSKKVVQIDKKALNQSGAVYMGTVVSKGHCTAEIYATGKSTQMGIVSDMLTEIEEEKTPLQKKLGELGKIIGISCIVICIVVSLAGIFRGYGIFDMLFVGITLAVAAIPEGLPATVTISLALAVKRIYKQKALVNKLHSVETLGCTNVICTDKTGTLTLNKMTVTEAYADGHILHGKADAVFKMLFTCGVLCNNATKDSGDPTETALLEAAGHNGIDVNGYVRINEVPFESGTRFMEVTVRSSAGETVSFSKGAPDVIVGKCSHILTSDGVKLLSFSEKKKLEGAVDAMTGKALRVLAFSYKKDGGYIFIGIMGMNDPLRLEVKEAVRKCGRAGIRVLMLTGDHPNTALEIAKQAGIGGDICCTGDEIGRMNDSALIQAVRNVSVFARISPAQKLRIVRAVKADGNIVAMTGDGVNDAPAVKEASIGVAMGINGTDVTKEAAKLVLLDDNFSTLVNAVEQGRVIYGNIRKFIRYMLSCNIGEVFTMLFAMLCGMPVVLLPIQLLLINLVTDGLPAIALSMEPCESDIMKKTPRKADESIFAGGMLMKIIVRGFFIGLCTLCAFSFVMYQGGEIDTARTCALITLGLSQLVFVFECKNEKKSIFNADYKGNIKLVLASLASALLLFAVVFQRNLGAVFATVIPAANFVFTAVALSFVVPVVRGIWRFFCRAE